MNEIEPKAPTVSVSMITYNHEKFIAQAIEGVLMQETDFDIELLIHDDASTDNTADIIREYEKQHPDIIKPIYQIENQHSQGVKVGVLNRSRARGKYIAFCEGDDYWTDPKKLQKQVDLMDLYPDCTVCGHLVKRDDHIQEPRTFLPSQSKTDRYVFASIEDLLIDNFMATLSAMYRMTALSKIPVWFYDLPHGSWGLRVHCALQGRIIFINEVMGYYRRHPGGVYSSAKPIERLQKSITVREVVRRHLPNHLRPFLDAKLQSLYRALADSYAAEHDRVGTCRALRRALRYTSIKHWLFSPTLRWWFSAAFPRFSATLRTFYR